MLVIAPRQLFWQAYYKHGLPDRHSPLTFAVADRDYVMVEQLVRDGHDVNARNRRGGFPMYYAVNNDDLDMVRLLHSLGAIVGLERNLLWRARSAVMVDLLVALGADPNGKSDAGLAPLHNAIYEEKFLEVIEALVKHGADINVKTDYDTTPLWEAIANYATGNVVACLLDHGADLPESSRSCGGIVEWLQETDPWREDLIAFVREYQRTNGESPRTFGEFVSSFGAVEELCL